MDIGHASADPLPVRKDLPDEQQFFSALSSPRQIPFGIWPHPAIISPNKFVYKSLSNWSFNIAVGCSHGCTFCYVPEVSTIKLAKHLAAYGVADPDEEWGRYVLLRSWDEQRFLASLRVAESTPRARLNPDGNRAVIYCSTTDPYQVFRHPDPQQRKNLSDSARHLVRRSLELIRERSTLNVRILTRSPLAKRDFDLFQSFGKRLLFGMSLPTLRDDLARVYEPKAPAPSQRLKTLRAAKEAGLHVFVALAPTYPECDELDLDATLKAAAQLEPVTVFHEPINIRAENVERIKAQGRACGVSLKTDVFASAPLWQDYARGQLKQVYQLAKRHNLTEQLHLWPDKSLGSRSSLRSVKDPIRYVAWLQQQWNRVSAWPQ
jgi:DNA repair photolyase